MPNGKQFVSQLSHPVSPVYPSKSRNWNQPKPIQSDPSDPTPQFFPILCIRTPRFSGILHSIPDCHQSGAHKMSFAPIASLRPQPRPSQGMFQDMLRDVFGASGFHLPPGLATNWPLFLACILLLCPLIWRVSRHAALGSSTFRGRWRMYPIQTTDAHPPCKWHVGSMRMPSGMQKWRCATCGKDGFSNSTTAPTECKWSAPVE